MLECIDCPFRSVSGQGQLGNRTAHHGFISLHRAQALIQQDAVSDRHGQKPAYDQLNDYSELS
jgi:hypothetical protein